MRFLEFYHLLNEDEEEHAWPSRQIKSLGDYGRSFSPDRRIHTSNYDYVKLVKRPNMQIDDKPRYGGIWYGCGDSWIDFLTYNPSSNVEKYIHEIFIDPSMVHFIRSENDYDLFTEKYGAKTRDSFRRELQNIDWGKAARDHSGLDMCEHYKRDSGWRHAWDVPSGVIWDEKAIKDSKLIAEWDGKQYVPAA